MKTHNCCPFQLIFKDYYLLIRSLITYVDQVLFFQAMIIEQVEEMKKSSKWKASERLSNLQVESRPEDAELRRLDSSLKKNTAFVRKIKSFTESQKPSILKGDFQKPKLISYCLNSNNFMFCYKPAKNKIISKHLVWLCMPWIQRCSNGRDNPRFRYLVLQPNGRLIPLLLHSTKQLEL